MFPAQFAKLLLLVSGCSKNSKDEKLLSAAGAGGDASQIKVLLSNGANINYVEKTGRHFTPLLWACFGKNYTAAKTLLENGANPNVKSNTGETPLHYAMAGQTDQDYELVKLLLEKGADPSELNRYSQLRNLHPMIKELIEQYARPKTP